jgi:hypothetical protein
VSGIFRVFSTLDPARFYIHLDKLKAVIRKCRIGVVFTVIAISQKDCAGNKKQNYNEYCYNVSVPHNQ